MKDSITIFLKKHDRIIGIIASTVAVIMVLSMIEILVSNINKTSHIFIQPLATSINGVFWSIYGYNRKDLYIIFPNVLAVVLGTITALSVFLF